MDFFTLLELETHDKLEVEETLVLVDYNDGLG